MDDLRRVWLGGDGIVDRSHLLRADCGLGASVFWESLCLDGGVGPSNLRVHLEIDHRCRYRWWGAPPSSAGRSASAGMKCGPKLLVPALGPGGGPSSELMFR